LILIDFIESNYKIRSKLEKSNLQIANELIENTEKIEIEPTEQSTEIKEKLDILRDFKFMMVELLIKKDSKFK
jgi:hypothetical protein